MTIRECAVSKSEKSIETQELSAHEDDANGISVHRKFYYAK